MVADTWMALLILFSFLCCIGVVWLSERYR